MGRYCLHISILNYLQHELSIPGSTFVCLSLTSWKLTHNTHTHKSMGIGVENILQRDPIRVNQSHRDKYCAERQLRKLPVPLLTFQTPTTTPSSLIPIITKHNKHHQMTNFFVAYITPTLLNASSFGMYFLFCGCVVITVVIGALFMPETRGQPLESIAEAFSHHSARSTTLMRLLLRFVAFIRGFSERHGYRHRATTTTTATVVRGPDTPEL